MRTQPAASDVRARTGEAPAVGLLYPGSSAADDFPRLEERLAGAVRLPLVHTSVGEDAHRVDALLDLGSAGRLAEGAAALTAHEPDAVMWACTSGSFVFGWDGAHEQAAELSRAAGRPASSTSLAFVAAARALGLTRVAVAASYPQDVAEHFVGLLAVGGVEVVALGSHGIVTAAEVGTLGRERVVEMVLDGDHRDAQAVLVPDTALHSLAWLDDLEDAVGKPVLTANQVTVWEGLRIAGASVHLPGLGRLFRP
ncbi:maleate cis-trans isomerase family protein [Georgenia subflava]|uniref:Maleate cis-trans isomerase n=1 Tax=Georgenia subflava TaxID=1622177 RepID=A0A6N7EVA4_9MICO|nr:maleate cis-trans isomerase [Georgenia subflava]MPV39064.1 maleate cis-trans isomerase [Georgenia subflava]